MKIYWTNPIIWGYDDNYLWEVITNTNHFLYPLYEEIKTYIDAWTIILTKVPEINYNNQFPNPREPIGLERFFCLEIQDQAIYDYLISQWGSVWWILNMLIPAESITWIKENTDLIELTPWVFELSPAWVDEIMWEVPTTYLTIN